MAIGMGTALLIGAGISAGTQVYGAHKASSGAKKAAEQQQASGREALAMQQQLMNPYIQQGQQANARLSSMLMGGQPWAYSPAMTSGMFPMGRSGPGLSRPEGVMPPPWMMGGGAPMTLGNMGMAIGSGVPGPSGPMMGQKPATSLKDMMAQFVQKHGGGGGVPMPGSGMF